MVGGCCHLPRQHAHGAGMIRWTSPGPSVNVPWRTTGTLQYARYQNANGEPIAYHGPMLPDGATVRWNGHTVTIRSFTDAMPGLHTARHMDGLSGLYIADKDIEVITL